MPTTQIRYIISFLFWVVIMNSSVFTQGGLYESLLRKALNAHQKSVNEIRKSQKNEILSAPGFTLMKDFDWQNNPSVAINTDTIDLSGCASGNYFLRLMAAGSSVEKQIVIMH